MSKSSSVLFAAVAAVVACAFPASAEDITAAVRAAGKGTASLTDGFEPYYSNQPASKAFDGNHVEETGRLLISQTGTQPGQEVWVRYDIADDFQQGMDIIVESFTFWYSICSGDNNRTPTWMRLEASATGNDDDWVVVAENAEPFVWENRTDHFYTVPVPAVRQTSYRHYRFVTSKNASILTIHELVLDGRIAEPREDLTWNGGEGGTWDATAANWKNAQDESVAWSPAARANIGAAAVTVSGTLDVGEVRFSGASALTGDGTLNLIDPAKIGVAVGGTAVATGVNDYFYGEDTTESCAVGTRTTDYTYLPRNESSKKTGVAVIWWKNRRLADIVGFGNATIYYSGNRVAAPHKFVNNGSTASVQFQCPTAYSGTRGGPGNWAELCAKVEFAQVGPDITARLVCAGYVWSQDFLKKQGCWDEVTETVDVDKHSPGCDIYDDSKPSGTVAGLKGLLAITEWKRGLTVVDNREPMEVVMSGRLLPDPATEGMKSSRVLYAKNVKLADMVDFPGAILHYNQDEGAPAAAYNVKRSATAIDVQYQRMYNPTAIICVKAEFTEENGDVYVQGMDAKYKNGVTEANLGFDFDGQIGSGYTTICGTVGDVKYGGYTLSAIGAPTIRNISCCFNGPFNVVGKVVVDKVDLAFGGAVAISSADTFAETPLALTDGAALSVAEGIAAVTPTLTFAGAATLTFADGASLEAEDIDLSAAETVTVVAAEGAKWMKVGRALTKAELRKFAPGDGFRAAQDAEGCLFAERVPGIILIVR